MMDELAKLLLTLRETLMKMSETYINNQLYKAQQLLWSGSLHEVDEAHNIIANLITQFEEN